MASFNLLGFSVQEAQAPDTAAQVFLGEDAGFGGGVGAVVVYGEDANVVVVGAGEEDIGSCCGAEGEW